MTDTPTSHTNAVTVGSLVSGSLAIFFSRAGFFSVVSIAFSIPAVLFSILIGQNSSYAATEFFTWANGAELAISAIMSGFLNAVFVYAIITQLRGERASVSTLLSRGLNSIRWAIGAVVVINILISLGLLLLVVPGLIMACIWFVAIPVAVLERVGPIEAISRSAEMTEGYRWTFFGFIIVFGLSMAVLEFGIMYFLGWPGLDLFGHWKIALVANALLTAPFYSIFAIAAGYAYVALSTDSGRSSLEEIAAVFD